MTVGQVLKEEQKHTREQQSKQQVRLELMENMVDLLLVVVFQQGLQLELKLAEEPQLEQMELFQQTLVKRMPSAASWSRVGVWQ